MGRCEYCKEWNDYIYVYIDSFDAKVRVCKDCYKKIVGKYKNENRINWEVFENRSFPEGEDE